MPALQRRLPSRRDGAGVRKPPKEETATRKGVEVTGAIYGDLMTTRGGCRALGTAAEREPSGWNGPGKRTSPK